MFQRYFDTPTLLVLAWLGALLLADRVLVGVAESHEGRVFAAHAADRR